MRLEIGFCALDAESIRPGGTEREEAGLLSPRPALPCFAEALLAMRLRCNDRQDDVVTMFLELQNALNTGELVRDAKINCGGRTEEIHRPRTLPRPGIDIFEVKPGFFLLKKYSHTLRVPCVDCAPAILAGSLHLPTLRTGRLTDMSFIQIAKIRNS